MLSLLVMTLLVQAPRCGDAEATRMRDAAALADGFDLLGAAEQFAGAAAAGCMDADAAAVYLRGLLAARAAYRMGGSPQSLEPVRGAEAALERFSTRGVTWAATARVVLMAAAAAAQSERGDMEIFLTHAVALESTQASAGSPRLPGVTAHEAAGDLWLQVHWFDSARSAYLTALRRSAPLRASLLGSLVRPSDSTILNRPAPRIGG